MRAVSFFGLGAVDAVAVETGGAAALGGRVLFAEGLSTVIAFGVGLEVGCGEGFAGGLSVS